MLWYLGNLLLDFWLKIFDNILIAKMHNFVCVCERDRESSQKKSKLYTSRCLDNGLKYNLLLWICDLLPSLPSFRNIITEKKNLISNWAGSSCDTWNPDFTDYSMNYLLTICEDLVTDVNKLTFHYFFDYDKWVGFCLIDNSEQLLNLVCGTFASFNWFHLVRC